MKKQVATKTPPKNISVFLRLRPPLPREANCTYNNLTCDPADRCKVTLARKGNSGAASKSYFFNRVFPQKTTQSEIYNEVGMGAVEAAFDGLHGVLFVYGQTGSGKTYTISNEDPENPGVLQQSLRDIWKRINQDTEHEYTCSVSYVQLYNEILTDLLDPQKSRVRIQIGPESRGDVVLVAEATGASIEKKVRNYDESIACFRIGAKRKEMTSTSMNNTSSRSHTVFNFNITRSNKVKVVGLREDEADMIPTVALEGRLVICDLAGSERVSRSQVEGKSFDEATHINGSLLVLGKVVAALTESSAKHAPFRESKLTRILQYSLMGNGNTSIVVNCSPSDDSTEETQSAILFGQRAIKIKQDAKRHEVLDYKALYLQLLAELDSKNDGTLEDALQEERTMYEDRIRALEDRVKLLTAENELLREENAKFRSGGGKNAGDPAGWVSMSKQMRETLMERDEKIRFIGDERFRLAILLAEEKRTAFRLAEKLRAAMVRRQTEVKQWMRGVDEENKELSQVNGTEYVALSKGDASTTNNGLSPKQTTARKHVDPNKPASSDGKGELKSNEKTLSAAATGRRNR